MCGSQKTECNVKKWNTNISRIKIKYKSTKHFAKNIADTVILKGDNN